MIKDAISQAQEQAKRGPQKQRVLLEFLQRTYEQLVDMGMKDPESKQPKPQKPIRVVKDVFSIMADASKGLDTQVDKLVKLGFPEKLGVSEEIYRHSIPVAVAQPAQFKGQFDTPLLVDPRVSLADQMELQMIGGVRKKGVVASGESQRLRRAGPYQIWVQMGLFEGSSYERLNGFSDNESPLDLVEGFALVREYPQLVQSSVVRLLGTLYKGSDWRHDGQMFAFLGKRAHQTAGVDQQFISKDYRRAAYYPTKGIIT